MCCLGQLAATDELEGKFQALEGDNVDDELAAMKRGISSTSSASSSQSRDRSLPEGRPIRCAQLACTTPARLVPPCIPAQRAALQLMMVGDQ